MILKYYFNTIQVIKYSLPSNHNKKININQMKNNNLKFINNKIVEIENYIFNFHDFSLNPPIFPAANRFWLPAVRYTLYILSLSTYYCF